MKPIFVIQKHAASHLHYDFRLEINRTLVSWAIPKGPSMDHREKRLAIRTDDHPLEYATFEGNIPHGSYGAGTVMVWDIGHFDNIKFEKGKLVDLETCLHKGLIEIFLHGTKLQGGYSLVRMTNSVKNEQWLLIKMHDEYADARRRPTSSQPHSALTGRTMESIKKG